MSSAWHLPAFQPLIQQGIVCSQDKHDVEPSLWEKVTAVIVYNDTAVTHFILQLINHLEEDTQMKIQTQNSLKR